MREAPRDGSLSVVAVGSLEDGKGYDPVIQDVDETLKRLLVAELSKLPDPIITDASQITFHPPATAEASEHTECRINLYLHDVRENVQMRDQSWALVRRGDEGSKGRKRPPVRLDLSYLVTAHSAKDPAAEHRALANTLGVLLRFPYAPEECLANSLEGRGPEAVLITVVQPDDVAHTDAHNLWRVLGGNLRPSLSVVVTSEFDPFETKWTKVVREAVLGIGPGVPPDGPHRPLELGGVRVSAAGVITSADGQKPIAGASVSVAGREERATSDERGFWFILDLPAGRRRLTFKKRGYREQEVETVCPPPGRADQLEPMVVMLESMTDPERSVEETSIAEAALNAPALVELDRTYTVSLAGRLRHTDGRPAAYVPLRVGRHYTTTDADGVYTFHDLPTGEHVLVADLPGVGEVTVEAKDGTGLLSLPATEPAPTSSNSPRTRKAR